MEVDNELFEIKANIMIRTLKLTLNYKKISKELFLFT